jgi:hypothetical protein
MYEVKNNIILVTCTYGGKSRYTKESFIINIDKAIRQQLNISIVFTYALFSMYTIHLYRITQN